MSGEKKETALEMLGRLKGLLQKLPYENYITLAKLLYHLKKYANYVVVVVAVVAVVVVVAAAAAAVVGCCCCGCYCARCCSFLIVFVVELL